MRVFVIRHGIAEDRPSFIGRGSPDDYRALTDDGKRELRQTFNAVADRLEKIEAIFSSPLVRAQQTADILGKLLPHAKRAETALLRPEADCDRLLEWVMKEARKAGETVALVGHEPLLSNFVGFVISPAAPAIVEMKKGAVACLELSESIIERGGVLKWLFTPKLVPGK